eukprot:3072832-Rhodomonas_salina.1
MPGTDIAFAATTYTAKSSPKNRSPGPDLYAMPCADAARSNCRLFDLDDLRELMGSAQTHRVSMAK